MPQHERTNTQLIDISGVTLYKGGNLILRDVNASITNIERKDKVQGQVICFLGPSGIGKTQLSRVIAGLQPPTSGSVKLAIPDGSKVATKPGLVGMVPQNYPLFEYVSVKENIMIAGRQGGLTPVDCKARADEFISILALGEHVNKYPRDISGGTRQRVAIARQMMCAGHYLVMDEPFSGQDPVMKMRASELITKIANMHTWNTIIVVTHDVTEGLSVADTCWLMGFEKTATGEFVPGARVIQTFDLALKDWCWSPDNIHNPEFLQFCGHVKAMFPDLKKYD